MNAALALARARARALPQGCTHLVLVTISGLACQQHDVPRSRRASSTMTFRCAPRSTGRCPWADAWGLAAVITVKRAQPGRHNVARRGHHRASRRPWYHRASRRSGYSALWWWAAAQQQRPLAHGRKNLPLRYTAHEQSQNLRGGGCVGAVASCRVEQSQMTERRHSH
jgi:hypothetical protein